MSKSVYISIVSHAQEAMVVQNFNHLPKSIGAFEIKLSLMDNTGSSLLRDFCAREGLFYYHDGIKRGFGANHNKLFSLVSPQDEDIFIICNPDVRIEIDQMHGMLESFSARLCDLYSVKTYFDKEHSQTDNPDKYFPGFFNFAVSLATDNRLHYGTNALVKHPQWLSGAFILFRAAAYRALEGFDERYFMYCEDIDICFRARKMGLVIEFDHDFYIEHETQMDSRALFSPNMIWHVQSAVKFIVNNKRFNPLVIAK